MLHQTAPPHASAPMEWQVRGHHLHRSGAGHAMNQLTAARLMGRGPRMPNRPRTTPSCTEEAALSWRAEANNTAAAGLSVVQARPMCGQRTRRRSGGEMGCVPCVCGGDVHMACVVACVWEMSGGCAVCSARTECVCCACARRMCGRGTDYIGGGAVLGPWTATVGTPSPSQNAPFWR